ncbi:ABC-type sugar transport system, permease component [Sphaerochaeta pleomorpha str. Grapes]|uniref:sn-glycerol-3-phosphate transport system permease protein UgpE n=1 Tax=Sphaerochaeta pleomorpha (strain ATCC BAA-1885 / DSM 22778 / Grapes) TaxID=158190 RepID=G8QXB4_SPHPG|nr:carbohydrate ABC transporter permease [Sphaerochaeta pleomorpha]AEV28415.1 ABC-type sugar transport system, permease component [Sphaerochaeta pleomorpha str. Grapes]
MNTKQLKKKPQRTVKPAMVVLEIVAVFLFVLFMIPFGMVVLNSAKTSKEIIYNAISLPTRWNQMMTNVMLIFNNATVDYQGAFIDSILITFFSLLVIVLFSSMCAWVLVRNKTTWSRILFMTFVSAMVIPFQVLMYPLVRWMRVSGDFLHFRLLGTIPGIVFAYLGFGCSLSIFIFHGFIKNIPYELEESATIDGCSRGRTFFAIVFPLLQPIIITVLILNGIWIWNDYLLPLLMLGSNGAVQTIPIAVTAFAGAYLKQWDLILTSTLIAMLPIIILYLFAQRYIIKGMVEGSIK